MEEPIKRQWNDRLTKEELAYRLEKANKELAAAEEKFEKYSLYYTRLYAKFKTGEMVLVTSKKTGKIEAIGIVVKIAYSRWGASENSIENIVYWLRHYNKEWAKSRGIRLVNGEELENSRLIKWYNSMHNVVKVFSQEGYDLLKESGILKPAQLEHLEYQISKNEELYQYVAKLSKKKGYLKTILDLNITE